MGREVCFLAAAGESRTVHFRAGTEPNGPQGWASQPVRRRPHHGAWGVAAHEILQAAMVTCSELNLRTVRRRQGSLTVVVAGMGSRPVIVNPVQVSDNHSIERTTLMAAGPETGDPGGDRYCSFLYLAAFFCPVSSSVARCLTYWTCLAFDALDRAWGSLGMRNGRASLA